MYSLIRYGLNILKNNLQVNKCVYWLLIHLNIIEL